MVRLPFLTGAAVLALLPGHLAAQATDTPLNIPLGNSSIAPQGVPVPAPVPTPAPLPSPVVPTPAPLPSPVPSPAVAAAPRPRPTSTATAAPRPVPSPRASSTPVSAPTAAASPTPAATASPPMPIGSQGPRPTAAAPRWPWVAGGAVLLAGLGLLLLRRRRRPADIDVDAQDVAAPDPVAPARPAPPPPPRGPAARLDIAFRPLRAGLNMVSATVDAELVVTNHGEGPATDIRAAVGLVAAHRADALDLAPLAAGQPGRPAVPPFALGPGEERRFRTVAALPLAAIEPLAVGGRPMFVPMVAVALQWRDPAGPHGAAQAWAVGVERGDAAKLAPIWLDGPSRTYDRVAARPHGEPVQV